MKKILIGLIAAISLGSAAAQAKVTKKIKGSERFTAAVIYADENKETMEVWLNTKEAWQEKGALTDGYYGEDNDVAEKIVDAVRLCNLAESQYEACKQGRTMDQIKTDLAAVGVEVRMEECTSQDNETSFQCWAQEEIKKNF